MQQVNLPDGTLLNFPDGMSQDDMRAAIISNFPKFAPEVDRGPATEGDPLRKVTETSKSANQTFAATALPPAESVLAAQMQDVAPMPDVITSARAWQGAAAGRGSPNDPRRLDIQKPVSTGSVFDRLNMDPPQVDAALNEQAMLKSVSPDSVMFEAGRGKQRADGIIADVRQADREKAVTKRKAAQVDNMTMQPVYDPETGALIGESMQPGPEPDYGDHRSAGDFGRDVGVATLKIGPTALKTVAQIYAMGTGGLVGKETSQLMDESTGIINEMFGSKASDGERKELASLLHNPDADATDLAKFLVTKPMLMADMGISNVGSMFVPAGAAIGISKILGIPLSAAAATAVANTSNAVMNAADTFEQTNGDFGNKAFAASIAGLGSYAIGRVTEGGAEGLLARQMAGAKSAAPIRSALTNALLKEPGQEFVENVSQQVGQDLGEGKAPDVNSAVKQGVLGAMIAPIAAGPVSVREAMQGNEQKPLLDAQALAKSKGFLVPAAKPTDILQATSVDEAIQTAQAALAEPTPIPEAAPAAGIVQDAQTVDQAIGAAQSELASPQAQAVDNIGAILGAQTAVQPEAQAEPAAPVAGVEPVQTWFGRRGDGYQSQEDAGQALPGRQKAQPEFDWKIEQMPNGRFRLAGYALENADASPVVPIPGVVADASGLGNSQPGVGMASGLGIDSTAASQGLDAASSANPVESVPARMDAAGAQPDAVAPSIIQDAGKQHPAPAVDTSLSNAEQLDNDGRKLNDGLKDNGKILTPGYYSEGYPWQTGWKQESGTSISIDGRDILAGFDKYRGEGMRLRDAIRHAEIAGDPVPQEAIDRLATLQKQPDPRLTPVSQRNVSPEAQSIDTSAAPVEKAAEIEQVAPKADGVKIPERIRYYVTKSPAYDGIEPLSVEDADFELEALENSAKKGRLTPGAFAQSEIGKRIDGASIIALQSSLKADPVGTIQALRSHIENKSEPAQVEAPKSAPVDSRLVPVSQRQAEVPAAQRVTTDWKGQPWDGASSYGDPVDSKVLPGDIGTGSKKNTPWASRGPAVGHIFRNRSSDTQDVVQVGKDAFVVRPKANAELAMPEVDQRLVPVSQRQQPSELPDAIQDNPRRMVGQNYEPIDSGAKPFKFRKDAKDAQKQQPHYKVVALEKGFGLIEKTPGEIAAQEQAAKRLARANAGEAGKPESAHAFIISKGGLNQSAMADTGFDRNVRIGNRFLFAGKNKGGLTLAQAAELLHEAGYIGDETETTAANAIKRSATVAPLYTPEGIERMAEAEAQARFDDHLNAEQEAALADDFDPFQSAEDLGYEMDDAVSAGYDEASDPIKLEVNALLAQAEAAGIDTETLREDAARETLNQSEQAYYERTKLKLQQAIAQGARSSGDAENRGTGSEGRQASEQGSSADRGEDVGGEGDAGNQNASDGRGIQSPGAAIAPAPAPKLEAGQAELDEANALRYKTPNLARLLADGLSPTDGFEMHLLANSMKIARAYNQMMTAHNGDFSGIEYSHPVDTRYPNIPTKYAFVLPDASQPGKWRISYFDKNGFSRHESEKTLEAAQISLVTEGYSIEDKGALDRLASTKEWARGTALADLIMRLNRGDITHAQFIEYQNKLNEDDGNAREGLTSPTPEQVTAQQDRAANADELDQREQINREADRQTLTQPVAPEQRRDNTGDIFGGPTVEDAQRARELEQQQAAEKAKKNDDGTMPMFSKARPDQTKTKAFRSWFKKSKVVDEDGKPLRLFHGTTADFNSFDRSRGNIESDWGAGFYFTNTPEDVAANYAGEGPDLTQKIERYAERLESEADGDLTMDEAREKAREHYSQHGGATMPVYLSIQNPLVIGGENETFLTYEEPYNEDTDEYGEATGTLLDFIDSLRQVASRFDDGSTEGVIDALMNDAYDGGISASKLQDAIKGDEQFGYYTDQNGDLASHEIVRQALERAGFDGIIDHTVDQKFGSQRRTGKQMTGMREDTVHYIAFEPSQIKSAIGNKGTFDANNEDIRFAKVSEEKRIRAVDLYATGLTYSEVAKELGISGNSVLRYAKEAGIGRTRSTSQKTSAESVRIIIEQYQKGKTTSQAGMAAGVSGTTAANILRDAGIIRTSAEARGVTDEKLQKAVELYAQGISGEEVSRRTGISPSTAINAAVRAGAQRRNRSEAQGISEALKQEAIALYDSGLTATEVAERLSAGVSSVTKWVNAAGVGRGPSRAAIKSLAEGRSKPAFGISSRFNSAKNGTSIKADSTLELARIAQLEADPQVRSFSRSKDMIPYGDGRHYNPDFRVEYQDGSVVVEEVKPPHKLDDPKVVEKAKAALDFYSASGVDYRLVSMSDIGIEGMDLVDVSALGVSPEHAKRIRASLSSMKSVLRRSPAMQRSDEKAGTNGMTREEFNQSLSEAFGKTGASGLLKSGVVTLLEDQSELPTHVVPYVRQGDKVFGFFDPKTQKTYGVLSNLNAGMVKGLALHEVGVHYGFETMLGDKKYAAVMRRLDVMEKAGQKDVVAAAKSAKENSVNPRQIPEERLAYLVQNNPEMGIVREIIAAIKAFLFREFGIGEKYLTSDDLTALAKAAVMHASRTQDGGSFVPAFAREPSIDRAPVWKSALLEGVNNINAKALTGAMWKDGLKGLVNKGLVKQDEIAWSGLDDWLTMQQGKVPKEAVLQYLQDNGVKVTETMLGDDLVRDRVKAIKDTFAKQGYTVEFTSDNEEISDMTDKAGEPVGYEDLPEDLQTALNKYDFSDAASQEARVLPKYGQYQLPGGRDYRELLLTLPEKATEDQAARRERRNAALNTFPQTAESRAILEDTRGETSSPSYRSSHWDQPNVLAHIRFNERTDADGKRVLFIEEIQSDWGQQGKKGGFAIPNKVEIVERPGHKNQYNPDGNPLYEVMLNGESHGAFSSREVAEQRANQWKGSTQGSTPNAPFVTKTDAWVSLAMKRMIRYAVDNGFDKIAFVNGEQSADRYDLSKQISRVEYTDKGVLTAIDTNGREVLREEIPENKIEDYIGKDPARKLLESTPVRDPGRGDINAKTRRIEGDGLKVGGEGMRAFYDKIVPAVAKDVLKKLGGGKLERSFSTGESQAKDIGDFLASVGAATGENNVVHHNLAFDITPAMREKASQGLPMFSKKAGQTDTPEFRKWFGDSKVVDADGRPLIVYHGTKAEFSEFMRTRGGEFGPAIYLTDSPREASEYGDGKGWGGQIGTQVMPLYVSIKNPYTKGVDAFWKEFGTGGNDAEAVAAAQAAGYDGIISKRADRYYDNEAREFVDRGGELTHYIAFDPKQVKSAIGNNGAFDPTNPDIRFSRQIDTDEVPAPTENSPWRDPAGRLQFAPGQWLYDKIGDKAGPLLDKLGLKAASPELRHILRRMKLDVAKAQETATAVAHEAMKLSDEEREMVSDLIEKELKAGTVPPEHAIRLAAIINSTMETQTNELVRLEMLSKESADRWRGQYLPRFYESKMTEQAKDLWADAMRGMRSRPEAMKGIKGKHLKGRGMYETIPESQLKDYETMGWEVRDPDYTPSMFDGTVQVWRDFTRQERDAMGEIRDSGFRFVMGYMQTQKDIALGKMFESLAQDPDLSSRLATEKFLVQVPATKIAGTEAKMYGKLAGRWVSPETLSQLTAIEESHNDVLQMYRKAMGLWKEGKTVLNPVSHANNIISNISMAHFAGVSMHRVDKYIGAMRDFAKKSDRILEAKEAGLFLGTLSEAELMNTLPDELKLLAQRQESGGEKAAQTAMNLMSFYLRKPMGWAYQAEDTFFRYLIYKDAREQGMEPADAVDHAQNYIFTYDDLPKGARRIRDYGIPFFAYTYKAIPALLHTALTHPLRMAAPAAVLWAANAAAYAIGAGDDDDKWYDSLQRYIKDPAFRSKAKEKEKLERELLPQWMKGHTALGTQKTVRLGTDELTKLPLFMDMSRMVPGGDLFDVSPNAGGLPIPQPFTPSHPIFTTLVGMLANKDLYFGKELVDANDTRGEATQKRLAWLWKQMSPAIAINNYHWERGMNALARARGGEVKWIPDAIGGDQTGIGRDGLPVQPKYAVPQTFGIKIRPIDLDLSEKIDSSQRQKMLRDIDAEMNRMRRLVQKGAVAERTYEKAKEEAGIKKERIKDGLTVDGDSRD